jgi:4-hydroxybenzoate polyprenyltransferase
LRHGSAWRFCLFFSLRLSALLLPAAFSASLAAYLVTTVAYSLYLKKQLLLDVVVLAGLYSLRVFAGGTAIDVYLSPWLAAFTIFFFLSLALVKRVSELQGIRKTGQHLTRRRAYSVDDLEPLTIMGVASGYISCFILALYMGSSDMSRQYHNPRWLWMTCPIAIYWVSRLWLLAYRGQVNEDPVLFATQDRASLFLLLFAAVVFALAI